MYQAYIAVVKNVRVHPNADRLDLVEVFGNTVCVGHGDFTEGDLAVYFPTDGQLSEEFCAQHDLVRRKDENGVACGGYLDAGKRNVGCIRLRGEKSEGLLMPLRCLEYTGIDISTLTAGFAFTCLNGHEICCKYIPRSNRRARQGGNRTRSNKSKVNIAPLFAQHADTEQLAYNLDAFKPGDEIEITLKMHGTSGRTARLPMLVGYKDSPYRRFINKIIMGLKTRKNWGSDGRNALYHSLKHGEPIYEYDYVSGTRRVTLDTYEGGYYGDNKFREQYHELFKGKLHKGETVYYEIVGYVDENTTIMGIADNKKVNDKEFMKQYGPTTTFSYGCEKGKSDIYVYRMTMTNPDGEVVEYTPDFMRYRCEQMGVKTVPVFDNFILHDYDLEMDTRSAGEIVKYVAEKFYQGPDPIGKTHIREGVVVRIVNRPKFCAYKHKNFNFKIISGIAIDQLAESGNLENMSEDLIAEL